MLAGQRGDYRGRLASRAKAHVWARFSTFSENPFVSSDPLTPALRLKLAGGRPREAIGCDVALVLDRRSVGEKCQIDAEAPSPILSERDTPVGRDEGGRS